MELQEICKITKKNSNKLLAVSILGLILGIGVFLYPKKFYTTGSLYITRKVEQNSPEYFKYEGYYAQQTAISHTETIMAILESTNIHAKTISQMNLTINKINLLKFKKNINIKKSSPQVLTITVKDNTPEGSYQNWKNLVELSTKNASEINNKQGDQDLYINIVDNPITTQNYYPLEICISLGILLSFGSYFGYLILLNYQKESK